MKLRLMLYLCVRFAADRHVLNIAAVAVALSGICWAARCTTDVDAGVLREYNNYVATSAQSMSSRFDSGELSWIPAAELPEAAAQLASGKLVRRNISNASLNERIAGKNGTILHWVGAILIPGADLATVKTVLEDYAAYDRMYQPLIFACRANRNSGSSNTDVVLGFQNVFHVASLFPQHFAFELKGHIDHSGRETDRSRSLRVHLSANDIRESDSGEPGRTDYMEQYHDHGILWALNAYWRARERANGVYLEFESVTVARSVQAFACKIGFVPVPKSVISAAMDSLPADSVSVILEGTKRESERRASHLERTVNRVSE